MGMTLESIHLEHAMRTLGASLLDQPFPSHEGNPTELARGFTWAGVVQATGDFSGGVAIRCGTPAAEALARGLLQETGPVSNEVLQTTLAELTQLVAGAIEPLLGDTVQLAAARSMQGSAVARMGEKASVVARTLLTVGGEAVDVAVFRV
jgi:hypothetical protein